MSVKKNSSIRDRLRELRVNEPERLSKSGPMFKPPAEMPAVVQNEVPPREAPSSKVPQIETAENVAPQSEQPQLEATHKEVTQREVAYSEVPKIELPQNEVSLREPPRNEVARKEATQKEAPKIDVAHTEEPRSEQPRFEGAHKESPQVELPQNEVTQFHVAQYEASPGEKAQNEVPYSEPPRKKQTKHEVPQNEGPSLAVGVQNELPQIEQPSRTFFRLSDRAFSYPQIQQLSGDCFRLFLWMSSRAWRYLNSDGTLRAAVSFIEDHTAMSHATISRCLKTLREERLIELLETDYKKGNVWSISPVAFSGCDPENLPPRSGGPQNEGPRNEAVAASKRDRASLNLRDKVPQIEGQIRNIYKSKKLSQEDAQVLFDRIDSIRAPEKQKAEREGLMQLLETHQPEELETALAYVEKYGTLSGEGCHSPFRYLAVAVDDVLQTCRKKGFSLPAKLNASVRQTESETHRKEQQDAERTRSALAAFQNELSTEERANFVEAYVAKQFAWGYKPSGDLAMRLAAVQWFDERQTEQRAVG